MMNEQRQIKIYQIVVLAASLLFIAMLFTAFVISGPGREWRSVQRTFYSAIEKIDSSGVHDHFGFEMGIVELDLEGMNRTDRCLTCHTGIENPMMEGAEQPYAFHPGSYLHDHSVEKYGCTICHGGQGRALNIKEAHALESDVHWDYPILKGSYIQSSCGQCHLSVFTENIALAGTEEFERGHRIFQQEGCLGCHKARGVGGILGPDLTEQGEKTYHEYSFQHLEVEKTVNNWLKEHFRDPEMVSPGSQMLKIDLPEEDYDALTTFVLGLSKPDIDFQYFSIEALKEFKGERSFLEGEYTYSLACAGCHGKLGKGKDYEEYATGVPGILNEDFLRLASLDYIEFTLQKGRSLRQMASWMTDISGLTSEEIDSLASYVKNYGMGADVPFRNSKYIFSSGEKGERLYAENCEACHGEEAAGGSALALGRRDLIRNVGNAYLFNTLKKGRGNAGMPSWTNLQEDELYALVKYLRNFGGYAPSYRSVDFEVVDLEQGKLKYLFNCSRCHGEAGQGQTGPALMNVDFLSEAEDAYLYSTISQGRAGTAMFGWSKDVYNAERMNLMDIGNVVGFLRAEAEKGLTYIYAGANPGDKAAGKGLFKENCAECHGNEGEGEIAPALNNQELLNAASNGYLMATMTVGRGGTAMPAWGSGSEEYRKLSSKERQDIVAWLRSWERVRLTVK